MCSSGPSPAPKHLPLAGSERFNDASCSLGSPSEGKDTCKGMSLSPSCSTNGGAGDGVLQKRAWEKLQREKPSPTSIRTRIQLCHHGASDAHPGAHPSALQVESLSCQAGGRFAAGGAGSYPTETQADTRTVLGRAAEPHLRGRVPQSRAQPQPQLCHHHKARLGSGVP